MNPVFRRLLAVVLTVCMLRWAGFAFGEGKTVAVSAVSEEIDLVVLMYHAVMTKESRAGDYVITPEALEADLRYISSQGFRTVVMEDLIAYVQDGRPLPDKPIMITFDDGYYNNYLNVYPLLQKYQMKAVISIIGAKTEEYSARPEEKNESYTHLTWDMIQEMQQSGLVEFQNHSYDLHTLDRGRKGAGKKQDESEEAYQAMLRKDLTRLQELFTQFTGTAPTTFTYPFGSVSPSSYPVVEELFQASLDAQGRVFHLTRDPQCLWRIPRFNRPWGTTAEEIIRKALPEAVK